jgi:hypothetical protein
VTCTNCIYPGGDCNHCPENNEEEPFCQCEKCLDPIFAGDAWWDFDGTMVCNACVEEMSGADMAEFLGYAVRELDWNDIENRRETHED